MCIHPGCKTRATFNVSGETKGLYCSAHKLQGMVDVKNVRCNHEMCNKQPVFNVSGRTKGLYCLAHKLQGMVDVVSKCCVECNKQPVFNLEGNKKALYCSEHKKNGMIDVINKRCIHEGCNKRPLFNVFGETTSLYCLAHKLQGMVDVEHKSCIHEGCNKRPNYNVSGEVKGLYCSAHKLQGMVDIMNKTCKSDGCKIRPTYNNQGDTRGLYCSAHKLQEMVDVINITCKIHLCSTQVTKKYDGYCRFCYINLFPDKPVSRNYKTKEQAVVEFVKTKCPEMSWVADKIIQNACSKRRPDLLLDLGYQVIIVEVDENQHADYDCSCENKRIMELSQDVGHRPIVFIRFNPDEYEKDGTTITSCWGCDKNGLCVVKKTKKNEWTDRLRVLEDNINYWVSPENTTSKTIETIQLFYDV
jgi:hypothetical protein